MTYTTNYNLKKPGTDDLVDIDDLNGNADIIDSALAGKQDTLPNGTADGDVLTWDDANDEWTAQAPSGGGYVAQDTAPLDTGLLWVDTSDNSVDGGYELVSNKVTAIDNTSTDTQYPSAKCVYDIIGDVETILADLIGGA